MNAKKSTIAVTCQLAMAVFAMGGVSTAIAAEAESDVMGKGNTQLEFKLGTSRDRIAAYTESSTPFVARIGVSETAEVRIITGGYIKNKTEGVTTRGWSDTNIGLRFRTQELDEKSDTMGMAWQLEQGLPTGASAFSSPGGSTALKFNAEWALPNDMSLGVQPGLIRVRNEAGSWYVAPSLAVTLGKNWTPSFRTVVELIAPQITSKANGGNVTFLNLGTTYRLTEMFELEATYARSLNKNAPENNFAAGVNIKF